MQAERILVVDDNHSIVKALELVLQREGFEVLTAFDGMAALESVVKNKPDLIILDIVMPRLNGYQVCQRLSVKAETKNIPVIMLTVKGDMEKDTQATDRSEIALHVRERWQAFEVGATEFFTKPIVAKNLVTRVKQILTSG